MNVTTSLPLEPDNEGSVHVRTLFISDVHLGTRGCQAEKLLEFLRYYEADTIFLVGDIVDGWALKSTWYWPQAHNDVVQKLLRKARKGARMIYIPGNHDEFLRQYYGSHFGGIEVVEDTVHVTANGRHYLVIHGDLFDVVIKHARWLALLGDKAYDFAIWLNTHFNAVRHVFGFTYWSLSRWAKLKVKNAVNFIGAFELALANEARRRGAEGVICGHIHHPIIRPLEGLVYVNCGDWVESCTAIIEHFDGRLEIIDWTEVQTGASAAYGVQPAAIGVRRGNGTVGAPGSIFLAPSTPPMLKTLMAFVHRSHVPYATETTSGYQVTWVKGQSGNPAGRPKGSKHKLQTSFWNDLHRVWKESGPDALSKGQWFRYWL